MRKTLNIVLILLTLFILTSCNKNNVIKYDDNLEELEYYKYLKKDNPVVEIIIKDFGTITLELFKDEVKYTVDNFLNYAINGDYKNTVFHRIIKNFMIQGGEVSNPNAPIKGEFNSNGYKNDIKHTVGVISMARTNVANSATSQFFIVHKNSPHLNGQYASFGGVVSGFDLLDEIANLKTNLNDYPLKEVIIKDIKVHLNGYKLN